MLNGLHSEVWNIQGVLHHWMNLQKWMKQNMKGETSNHLWARASPFPKLQPTSWHLGGLSSAFSDLRWERRYLYMNCYEHRSDNQDPGGLGPMRCCFSWKVFLTPGVSCTGYFPCVFCSVCGSECGSALLPGRRQQGTARREWRRAGRFDGVGLWGQSSSHSSLPATCVLCFSSYSTF